LDTNSVITVVGAGYVGLSLAIVLAQRNKTIILDVDVTKVSKINSGISPLVEVETQNHISSGSLSLHATTDSFEAYNQADYIIVAVPTDYSDEKCNLDTTIVEKVVKEIVACKPSATIVIKSTVPIGFTDSLQCIYKESSILFCPEFLREGTALHDSLYPSRIIVGTDLNNPQMMASAQRFVELLQDGAIKKSVITLLMRSSEAEAVKLFSNTFLALRVSFFNELDTYSEQKGLNTQRIIKGICADSRIGDYYNNPSFGYGGYCLPKDTKQLLNSFVDIPEEIIEAVIHANETRKRYIAEQIISRVDDLNYTGIKPIVGIFRITMKNGSDNYRGSPMLDIVSLLQKRNIELVIYEPIINEDMHMGVRLEKDLQAFLLRSDIIVANRLYDELEGWEQKVYTRDLYSRD